MLCWHLLLHHHNFHNFGRDPPHINFEVNQPRSFRRYSIWKLGWKNEEKKCKICNKCSISIISITVVATLPRIPHMKFEVNRSRNFRGDSVGNLGCKNEETFVQDFAEREGKCCGHLEYWSFGGDQISESFSQCQFAGTCASIDRVLCYAHQILQQHRALACHIGACK